MYQIVITCPLVFVAILVVCNAIAMKPLGQYGFKHKYGPEAPLVSILVPARNEADNIGRCVRSLLAQDYGNFELLILDDNSTDATATIVKTLAKADTSNRVQLLQGAKLAEGWLGKNWACHQLFQAAKGDFLLFTDADTDHGLRALTSAIAAMEQEQADLLSIFPRQQTESLTERLVVPLVIMFLVGLLPTWQIKKNPSPQYSAANGQFMCFRREAYIKCGGHAAVRGIVLEDVKLGQLVKAGGDKQILPDGSDSVSCRMYRQPREVWQGFSKNFYAFFGFNLKWFSLFLGINFLGYVAPYFWLLLAWLTHQPTTLAWYGLPLLQILIGWLTRLILATRWGFRGIDIFLHPCSILAMCAIGFNSIRWRRNGTRWKGRLYKM
jgi:chlorobactene glucosyltransferase